MSNSKQISTFIYLWIKVDNLGVVEPSLSSAFHEALRPQPVNNAEVVVWLNVVFHLNCRGVEMLSTFVWKCSSSGMGFLCPVLL